MSHTPTPASIYNPHQAGWDEGYAAGLAAGAEAMREFTKRIRLQTKAAVSYSLNETPRKIEHVPTTMEIVLSHFNDIAHDMEREHPLSTPPASGEGADATDREPSAERIEHAAKNLDPWMWDVSLDPNAAAVRGGRAEAMRIARLALVADFTHTSVLKSELVAHAAQIATLQAALEAKDQAAIFYLTNPSSMGSVKLAERVCDHG